MKRLVAVSAILLMAAVASTPSHAADAAPTCPAKIQRGAKYVRLTQREYHYAYRKTAHGKRRVIVARDVPVTAPCATPCARVSGSAPSRVTIRRGSRLVRVTRNADTYDFGACPTHEPIPPGTPLTLELQPGSELRLDFGWGRAVPLSGRLQAIVTSADVIEHITHFTVTSGAIDLTPTWIFVDGDCGAPSPSVILMTPGPAAAAGEGVVVADGSTALPLRLDIRTAWLWRTLCGEQEQDGFTTSPIELDLHGRLDGDTATLTSPAIQWDIPVCDKAGPADAPCLGDPRWLMTTASATLALRVIRG